MRKQGSFYFMINDRIQYNMNRRKVLWLIALLFAVTTTGEAQEKGVGRILSYKKTAGGITGKTAEAVFAVEAWSAHTIRVRISKEKALNSFSYALVSNETPSYTATVTEKGNSIELSTGTLIVTIEKAPQLRIVFKNNKGVTINEDMPGEDFGTVFNGNKVTSYKVLQEGERFVGLGEALGNLDRRGMGITLNNTDTYKYGDPRLAMYSSIPFYTGIHHDQVYGLFYNNSYKTFFNFGSSTPGYMSVSAEGGDADYFFFYDNTIAGVLDQYTTITGKMQMPPRWSIGYHQSRCSYYPQSQVSWIARTFREKKIPLDCIVLDADYEYNYQPFRINTQRFPDMKKLTTDLAAMQVEVTASVYPGIATTDSTYEIYKDGLKKDVFVKYRSGKVFTSEIAPVVCHFPDYTNPKTRIWWADKMKFYSDLGIHGYWNDMNEPAVAGSYLPDNLLFDFDGRKAGTLEAKNVFGFQMARSSYESIAKYGNGRRPFILTRSAYAGVQRYSAVWSGDNTASDEGLLSSVLLNNQLGLSGVAFCGYDVGGYIGDGTKEQFRRWIQAGAFSPYMRNHKEFFATANEPWSYGEEQEAIAKSYIGFRYRLMPYLYSAFYQASQHGIPVARSLCINYPFESAVYDPAFQYQFLFGDAILVAPVTSKEKQKNVYLPEGEWYDLFTDERMQGSKMHTQDVPAYKIPLYVKGSAIIPVQPLVQSTKEKPGDTLTLHVYFGKDENTYTLYEDEGDGYTNGKYSLRKIDWSPATHQLVIGEKEGTFMSPYKKIRVIVHGHELRVLEVNQQAISATPVYDPLFDPLEHLAGYYDTNTMQALRSAIPPVKKPSFVIDNIPGRIVIHWP